MNQKLTFTQKLKHFLLLFSLTVFCCAINYAHNTSFFAGPDVELTLSVSDTSLVQYEYRTFTLEVKNTGTETAFNLNLPFGKPENTSYVSSNANGGNFNAFTEIWSIPVLSPGQAFQLNYTVFILEDDLPITVFRELFEMSNADMDSTPGNGVCCSANEDDEAVLTLGGPPIDTTGVDLSLNLSVDNTVLELFFSRNYTLTVQNTGDTTAEDVKIDFPIPEGLAYVDHNASQGILDNFNGVWDVGNIAPGGIAYLNYELYIISEDTAIIAYVQVAEATPEDVDSAPGNGTCCTPEEDDEASVTVSKPFIGGDGIDLELSVDVDNPQLGQYVLRQLTYTLVNAGAGEAQEVVVQIPLPAGTTFGGYTTNKGSYGLGSEMWTVGTLAEGETATLNYTIFLFADDTPIETYAQVLTAVPFDIDSYPGNGQCCEAVEDDEASLILGGNVGDDFSLDLELELEVDNPQLDIYQIRKFTLTLTNNSGVVGQDIEVGFPVPEFMAYVSHNASQGVFDSWNGIWNVGDMVAGESVTLEYSLYTLTGSSPINVYAQVLSASPNDMDSTPDNGTCCTVNEDDEALVTLAPQLIFQPRTEYSSSQDDQFLAIELSVYPVPAKDRLFVAFSAPQEEENQIFIYNLNGQLVFHQSHYVKKGRNKIEIPVTHFPKSVFILTFTTPRDKHTIKWTN